jgi:glycosyltransferase involved in cell wall biosynthesis
LGHRHRPDRGDLLDQQPAALASTVQLRVLILNWRCPENPRAGGAEAVTFEIARRLVARGDSVEWFSAGFPGGDGEKTLAGVRLVRAGRQWSVHWAAYRRYRGSLRGNFDVVVDEVNTIPFFTPFWAGIPVVMFIHQLAREVWWYESPFPINAIGHAAETLYLRTYRKVRVLTVSASTRDDLLRLGFEGPITVIPEGLEPITDFDTIEPGVADFLYVGRLAPSKRIEEMIKALALVRKAIGRGDLRLVGSGSERYQASLMRLAKRLGVADQVQFTGRVSAADKHRLMAEATALLMTSVREGWGLVVTEANACGTPAIVYDVPGLRDSVVSDSTGLVVPSRPEALGEAMLRVVRDPGLRTRLATEAKRWSGAFSFDAAADLAREQLLEAAG